MVRAGALKHIIKVERLTSSGDNDYGESLETYQTLVTTRASINPISGNETFLSGLKNNVSHKIEVRVNPSFDYTPEDRIEFNGRYFDIIYILNWQERGSNLTLLAIEKYYKD